MKWYSQKKQDSWVIDTIFNYKKNGFFVDLAATNGISYNNTYNLEKELNWNGICIEPNNRYFEKLKQNRNCHVSNYVIDNNNDKTISFYETGDQGGIIDNDTDNDPNLRKLNSTRIVEKQTKTLEYILDLYNAPKVIDYLSLDVEGAEERVLSQFPFNKYKFLSMTIERPTKSLEKILFENDYVFVKGFFYEAFYVHKSIANFDKIKKQPYKPTPQKHKNR